LSSVRHKAQGLDDDESFIPFWTGLFALSDFISFFLFISITDIFLIVPQVLVSDDADISTSALFDVSTKTGSDLTCS